MEQKILIEYRKGLTNRQIAKVLGCHHNTVAYWLKKNKLSAHGNKRTPLNWVDGEHIKCSKCGLVKEINAFFKIHKQWVASYCQACRRKQIYDNYNKDKYKILISRFHRTKTRAKLKGIAFNLTQEDFINQYDKQNGLCFYTDELMILKIGRGFHRNALSIDKVVPGQGYVKGNIVFCTHKVNTIKGDLTLDELKKWIPSWYERLVQVAPGNF